MMITSMISFANNHTTLYGVAMTGGIANNTIGRIMCLIISDTKLFFSDTFVLHFFNVTAE